MLDSESIAPLRGEVILFLLRKCDSEKESHTGSSRHPNMQDLLLLSIFFKTCLVIIINRFPNFLNKTDPQSTEFYSSVSCLNQSEVGISGIFNTSIRHDMNYAFLIFLEIYFALMKFERKFNG